MYKRTYRLYRIHITHTLYAVCRVFAIHYKYSGSVRENYKTYIDDRPLVRKETLLSVL